MIRRKTITVPVRLEVEATVVTVYDNNSLIDCYIASATMLEGGDVPRQTQFEPVHRLDIKAIEDRAIRQAEFERFFDDELER